MNDLLWYALQVRPRCEKAVASALALKGYEGYLPLYSQRSCWSDRIKQLQLPLFSGYLFCRFDVNKRLPIMVTPGLIRVVGIGGTPYPVEEHEIQALQAISLSNLQAEPWSYLNIGQKVKIELGSLAGVEGILTGVKGSSKLVVSVSLLQRSVAVEIDESWVVPAGRTYAKPLEAINPFFEPNLVAV